MLCGNIVRDFVSIDESTLRGEVEVIIGRLFKYLKIPVLFKIGAKGVNQTLPHVGSWKIGKLFFPQSILYCLLIPRDRI